MSRTPRDPIQSRRTLLGSLACACFVPLFSCSSKQDVVGRVHGLAVPVTPPIDGGASNPLNPNTADEATPSVVEAGRELGWVDAGGGLEVIVRAHPAPPDAPDAEPWPLEEPIGFSGPAPSGSDFGGPAQGLGPNFDRDAGMLGAGGYDNRGEPDWTGPGDPRPDGEGSGGPSRVDQFELVLHFWGRDAQRLVSWAGAMLAADDETAPRLVQDSSGALYVVRLRLAG